MFHYLQVPVAPEKVEGPSTKLTFLGITLDTVDLVMSVPPDKVQDIVTRLQEMLQRGSIRRRELASVVGKLSFASQAIVAGRTFLRRLYDFMKASEYSESPVLRLPNPVKEDLVWWVETLQSWNGKSFFLFDDWTPSPDLQLQTDASGSWGYGAYFRGRWLQGTWSDEQLSLSITFKELYAIAVACLTWGSEWTRLRVQFHCDNSAVVACLKSGTSRSPPVMELIRSIYHASAKHDFVVSAVHIPGTANQIADAISRNLRQTFDRLAPHANREPDLPVLPKLS